jgi:hypothetical protein
MMQQDLAEFLGTTPPTLSRILGEWEMAYIVYQVPSAPPAPLKMSK